MGFVSRVSRVVDGAIDPFSLFLYSVDPPGYVLLLEEEAVEAVAEVFVEQGREGHASDWEAVAGLVAGAAAPDVADWLESDRLAFWSYVEVQAAPPAADEERDWANYFAVTASEADVGALRRLGALWHAVYHDRERLSELIRSADPELFEQ